jgi:hypothetical protein
MHVFCDNMHCMEFQVCLWGALCACSGSKKLTVVDLASSCAAEVILRAGWEARLEMVCRKATETELTRQDGIESLLKAVEGTKYSYLLAMIIKAKASHVPAALIARAQTRLKGLEVAKPCEDVKTLKKKLSWGKVTQGEGEATESCCKLEGEWALSS